MLPEIAPRAAPAIALEDAVGDDAVHQRRRVPRLHRH